MRLLFFMVHRHETIFFHSAGGLTAEKMKTKCKRVNLIENRVDVVIAPSSELEQKIKLERVKIEIRS